MCKNTSLASLIEILYLDQHRISPKDCYSKLRIMSMGAFIHRSGKQVHYYNQFILTRDLLCVTIESYVCLVASCANTCKWFYGKFYHRHLSLEQKFSQFHILLISINSDLCSYFSCILLSYGLFILRSVITVPQLQRSILRSFRASLY